MTLRGIAVALIRLAALALIVASAFAVVVLGIGNVPSSGQWTLLLFAALAAFLAALVYARLRGRITGWAQALVDRDEMASDDVARTFSRRAASGLPFDELMVAVVESLRSGFGATRAEVWAAGSGVLRLAAADPPREGAAIVVDPTEEAALGRAGVVGRAWLSMWLPALVADSADVDIRAVTMVHAGELVGVLLAERGLGRPAFRSSDEEALALLGRQAALALRNVRLGSALDASMEALRRQAGALRDSRARVVAAGNAERRRIERDLHDGAQQHLLGLAVNLKVARELQTTDPERAGRILAELSGEVHTALEQLRDLAHGIYPPLLAERGLGDAVRAALARSGLRGAVQVKAVDRHAADVEATVYFCCVEAIQNAAKHGAPSASIRLWEQDGAVMFDVLDKGPGFDPANVREGVGLTNMRDRVGALGGTLQVTSQPGEGVRITGAVPVVSLAAPTGTAVQP